MCPVSPEISGVQAAYPPVTANPFSDQRRGGAKWGIMWEFDSNNTIPPKRVSPSQVAHRGWVATSAAVALA